VHLKCKQQLDEEVAAARREAAVSFKGVGWGGRAGMRAATQRHCTRPAD
jgi:hypothetical protein